MSASAFAGRREPVRDARGRLRRVPRPRLRLPDAALEGLRPAASGIRGLRAMRGAAGAATPEQRLLQRIGFGWHEAELARLGAIGYDAYLEEQLGYEALDDGPLESVLATAFPTLEMSAAEIYDGYGQQPVVPIVHLILAAVYRALYSPRRLFERMVVFWTDHFNIDLLSEVQFLLKPVDDREVVRAHALGTFPDLLSASAHSPAMLVYLTNDSNDKDHPNENYARELMELHTMGADRGYTQRDVREVARCFTGWTIQGRLGGNGLGTFFFDAARHDDGEKTVLGQTIPAGGGIEDGERVLEILAGHPRTARFISRKLLRWFWGYEPRRAAVDQVANAYQNSGGDLRAMLRVVLRRSRMATARPKLKRPFHLMVSALRGLGAELQDPRFVVRQLEAAGHLPFAWPPPNGYPDSEGYWSGLILPRWNFAGGLPARRASGIRFPLGNLEPSATPAQLARRIDNRLFNGTLSESTRTSIEQFLAARQVNPRRIREAVGLAVASPEFQEY